MDHTSYRNGSSVPSLRALAFDAIMQAYIGNAPDLVDILGAIPPTLMPELIRRIELDTIAYAYGDTIDIVRAFESRTANMNNIDMNRVSNEFNDKLHDECIRKFKLAKYTHRLDEDETTDSKTFLPCVTEK